MSEDLADSEAIQPTQDEVRNISRMLNGLAPIPCESAGDLSDPDNQACNPLGRFTAENVAEIQSLVEPADVDSWAYSTEPMQLLAMLAPGSEVPSPIAAPGLPIISYQEIEVVDDLG